MIFTDLESEATLNVRCSKVLASPMDRRFCHRARPLQVLSRSSASESWIDIATRVVEDAVSMLSSRLMRAVLAVEAAALSIAALHIA